MPERKAQHSSVRVHLLFFRTSHVERDTPVTGGGPRADPGPASVWTGRRIDARPEYFDLLCGHLITGPYLG